MTKYLRRCPRCGAPTLDGAYVGDRMSGERCATCSAPLIAGHYFWESAPSRMLRDLGIPYAMHKWVWPCVIGAHGGLLVRIVVELWKRRHS